MRIACDRGDGCCGWSKNNGTEKCTSSLEGSSGTLRRYEKWRNDPHKKNSDFHNNSSRIEEPIVYLETRKSNDTVRSKKGEEKLVSAMARPSSDQVPNNARRYEFFLMLWPSNKASFILFVFTGFFLTPAQKKTQWATLKWWRSEFLNTVSIETVLIFQIDLMFLQYNWLLKQFFSKFFCLLQGEFCAASFLFDHKLLWQIDRPKKRKNWFEFGNVFFFLIQHFGFAVPVHHKCLDGWWHHFSLFFTDVVFSYIALASFIYA